LGKTFAELTAEEKNLVSHRGKALHEVKNEFDKVLKWIHQNMAFYDKI
jgi:XTP/dITP diphosphohydrolase